MTKQKSKWKLMSQVLSLALTASSALADGDPTNTNVSGTKSGPLGIPLAKILFSRLHTFEINEKIYSMKKNGLTEQSYVSGFTASGAMAYTHELQGDDIWDNDNDAGRNAGFEIVPYTVSLTQDGRVYISTSAISFKNMNSYTVGGSDAGGPFSVIDQLDVAVFEWDRDMAAKGIQQFKYQLVNAEAKIDILNESSDNNFLALKATANPVGGYVTYMNTGEAHETMKGFVTELGYGIEYNTNLKKGWRINLNMDFHHSWAFDGGKKDPNKVSAYNADLTKYSSEKGAVDAALLQFTADKNAYEMAQYGEIKNIPNESYQALTGIVKPKLTMAKPTEPDDERMTKTLYTFAPSLEISKTVHSGNEKDAKVRSPVRVGVGIKGNLKIINSVTGAGRNIQLDQLNSQLVTGRIFVNF